MLSDYRLFSGLYTFSTCNTIVLLILTIFTGYLTMGVTLSIVWYRDAHGFSEIMIHCKLSITNHRIFLLSVWNNKRSDDGVTILHLLDQQSCTIVHQILTSMSKFRKTLLLNIPSDIFLTRMKATSFRGDMHMCVCIYMQTTCWHTLVHSAS